MSKSKLTPADFRQKLTIKELVAFWHHERKEMFVTLAIQDLEWGRRLQARGICGSVTRGPDFDPVDYGLERRARPEKKIV